MAQGRIELGVLWYEGLENWVEIEPGIQVPPGSEIHVALPWVNESDSAITGHVDASVVAPDGSEAALTAASNQDREAEPGAGWYVTFEPFVAAEEGTYAVTATLSADGEELDSVTFEVVAGAGGVIDGGGIFPASMMMPVMMIMMIALMAALVKPLAGQNH